MYPFKSEVFNTYIKHKIHKTAQKENQYSIRIFKKSKLLADLKKKRKVAKNYANEPEAKKTW